jgi:hypothetical protein
MAHSTFSALQMVEHSAHHHTVNVEEKYGNSHNEEFYGK